MESLGAKLSYLEESKELLKFFLIQFIGVTSVNNTI